jgi:hypothetical protein
MLLKVRKKGLIILGTKCANLESTATVLPQPVRACPNREAVLPQSNLEMGRGNTNKDDDVEWSWELTREGGMRRKGRVVPYTENNTNGWRANRV